MTVVAISRHIEIFCQDTLHRVPRVVDIDGGAPRKSHVVHPRAWIIPSAYVESDIVATGVFDGLADGRVTLLGVECQPLRVLRSVASTEVHLDEVEATFLEIEVGVMLVVVVESHIDAEHVAVVVVAAGVASRIAIDARLESFGMDGVGHGFQSVGEACGMDEQLARRLIAPAEETIVDVDVVVAHVLESFRHHGVGLEPDKGFVDIDAESVPRTPPHGGAVLCRGGQRRQGNSEQGYYSHDCMVIVLAAKLHLMLTPELLKDMNTTTKSN